MDVLALLLRPPFLSMPPCCLLLLKMLYVISLDTYQSSYNTAPFANQ